MTIAFNQIIGHTRQIKLLKRAIAKTVLAHGLLFTGLKGVGKFSLASATAKALLCLDNQDGESCGICRACKWFDAGQHPDYQEISPKKKDITIDQIRGVRHAFRIPPTIGEHRTVVIRQASSMNPYASNALLKTLEEPNQGNFLFLTAEEEQELLPTIVSRCQRIRLSPLPEEIIGKNLTQCEGAAQSQVSAAASLSGGSYGKALRLIKGSDGAKNGILGLRREFIEKLQGIDKNDSVSLLRMAALLDQRKDDVMEFLEILLTWFHDLILYRSGVSEHSLANRDLVELIRRQAQLSSPQSLFDKIGYIEKAKRALQTNGNRLLTLEVLMIRIVRH